MSLAMPEAQKRLRHCEAISSLVEQPSSISDTNPSTDCNKETALLHSILEHSLEMSGQPVHSTGRGGAGNIGPDVHVYTDGGVVREGIQGESVDGDFSTGRGGAGNIGVSPRLDPQSSEGRRSADFVPEINQRNAQDEFHTGRGGAGNVYKEKYGGHSSSPDRRGFGDKVKAALHLDGKKENHASSPPIQDTTTHSMRPADTH